MRVMAPVKHEMLHDFFAFGVCVVKKVHGDALFVQASIRARAQDMMVVVTFFVFSFGK